MSVDPNNKYTGMQGDIYRQGAERWNLDARDHVVGAFDAHNAHEGYEHLFSGFETEGLLALDFGCGPGRNIVKYNGRFGRIDGADISDGNLRNAMLWCEHNGVQSPNLFKTNGVDLDIVPSDTYDIVFSTITMQHIAVHEIRLAILNDMYRVLKVGGWISIQMGFGADKADAVDYYDNFYDAGTTNGNMDVRITDTNQIQGDLERLDFLNFAYILDVPGPGCNHSQWIYFRAQK